MKRIQSNTLALIYAGSLASAIDASCATWGGIVAITGGGAAANPIGGFATVFCAGWGIGRLFG